MPCYPDTKPCCGGREVSHVADTERAVLGDLRLAEANLRVVGNIRKAACLPRPAVREDSADRHIPLAADTARNAVVGEVGGQRRDRIESPEGLGARRDIAEPVPVTSGIKPSRIPFVARGSGDRQGRRVRAELRTVDEGAHVDACNGRRRGKQVPPGDMQPAAKRQPIVRIADHRGDPDPAERGGAVTDVQCAPAALGSQRARNEKPDIEALILDNGVGRVDGEHAGIRARDLHRHAGPVEHNAGAIRRDATRVDVGGLCDAAETRKGAGGAGDAVEILRRVGGAKPVDVGLGGRARRRLRRGFGDRGRRLSRGGTAASAAAAAAASGEQQGASERDREGRKASSGFVHVLPPCVCLGAGWRRAVASSPQAEWKPRLFAGLGELPHAGSRAVLFSGRPDVSGSLRSACGRNPERRRRRCQSKRTATSMT